VGARVNIDSGKEWMTTWKRDDLGLLNGQARRYLGNPQTCMKLEAERMLGESIT